MKSPEKCRHRCDHLDCAEVRGAREVRRVANKLGIVVVEEDGTALNPELESKMAKAAATTTKKKTAKKPAAKKTAKKPAAKKNGKTKPKAAAKKVAKKTTKKAAKATLKKRTLKDLPKSKYCPRCDKTRKADAFYTFKRKLGPTLSTYCKPCYREANKEWKAAQE